jgi:hypothetical protein
VGQTTDSAELPAGLQSQHAQSLGDDHSLLLVVGGRNTLEDLQSLHSGLATGSLVGNHAANGLVEDTSGSTEVEGTTTGRIVPSDLSEVGVVLDWRKHVSMRFGGRCRVG